MKDPMRQCLLQKDSVAQVAWIPEPFAKAGGTVDLRVGPSSWDRGWTVLEVGAQRLGQAYVADRSQDYKRTREASDI